VKTRSADFRLLLFQIAVVISFVALAIPLWRLQIVQASRYRLQANENRFRVVATDAQRGVIYDRSGHVLARNMPRFSVSLIAAGIEPADEERILGRLAVLLNWRDDGIKLAAPSCRTTPGRLRLTIFARNSKKEGQSLTSRSSWPTTCPGIWP